MILYGSRTLLLVTLLAGTAKVSETASPPDLSTLSWSDLQAEVPRAPLSTEQEEQVRKAQKKMNDASQILEFDSIVSKAGRIYEKYRLGAKSVPDDFASELVKGREAASAARQALQDPDLPAEVQGLARQAEALERAYGALQDAWAAHLAGSASKHHKEGQELAAARKAAKECGRREYKALREYRRAQIRLQELREEAAEKDTTSHQQEISRLEGDEKVPGSVAQLEAELDRATAANEAAKQKVALLESKAAPKGPESAAAERPEEVLLLAPEDAAKVPEELKALGGKMGRGFLGLLNALDALGDGLDEPDVKTALNARTELVSTLMQALVHAALDTSLLVVYVDPKDAVGAGNPLDQLAPEEKDVKKAESKVKDAKALIERIQGPLEDAQRQAQATRNQEIAARGASTAALAAVAGF